MSPMTPAERADYIAEQMRDPEFAAGWNASARCIRKAAAADALAATLRPALNLLHDYMGTRNHSLLANGDRALDAYGAACRYEHPATPPNVDAGRGAEDARPADRDGGPDA